MAKTNELTLPGDIPGLLRRCSPVVTTQAALGVPVGTRTVVCADVRTEPGPAYARVLIDNSGPGLGLSMLALDLTDATGRAHAAWWLGYMRGLGEALCTRTQLEHDGEGWSIEVDGSRWSWGPYGDEFMTHVPALAGLDPSDPRLLEDGSRWVDAEALRLVCLHVAGRYLLVLDAACAS